MLTERAFGQLAMVASKSVSFASQCSAMSFSTLWRSRRPHARRRWRASVVERQMVRKVLTPLI